VKYRITYDDQRHSEIRTVEVEAGSIATAIFLAGAQFGNDRGPRDEIEVLKVEVPAGWMEVQLP
jgi:hypothetical protein